MLSTMSTAAPTAAAAPHRQRVSFRRLAWVGPLTVVVALVVNAAISWRR